MQTLPIHLMVTVAFTMLLASCGTAPSGPSVDIRISNDSTNDLTWLSVRWDEGQQEAGVLSAGVWKESLDAGLPKKPKSDTAFVEFADDKDGWSDQGSPNSERKLYRIPVDVSPLRQLAGGHYRVTFSILSFTEAKLQIEKRGQAE